MAIISAEYEERDGHGYIKLWPPPLPHDGRRIAEEFLSIHVTDGEPELSDVESRSLKRLIASAVSRAEDAVDELQALVQKLETIQDRMR